LGAEASGWYSRADAFHGSQSPLWISGPANHQQQQHLQPDPQHHQNVYSTEDDDSYVGQSVMGIGWKDVESMSNQTGIVVASAGQLLHPHMQQQQQQQLLQPRSASRTSVYSTTSSSDRDSSASSSAVVLLSQLEPVLPKQNRIISNQSINPLLMVMTHFFFQATMDFFVFCNVQTSLYCP
jgi:hypothetical protein